MTRSATHVLAELLGVPYAEKRELLDEFVASLAPPRNECPDEEEIWESLQRERAEQTPTQNEALRQSWARGQCAMVGTVADALPNDAEQDAIVEEAFARATKTKTPSKPLNIDAVLAPIERALEHIAGLSNDTRASEIATTAYGVAGNVLRQAVAKAREVGRG